MALRVLLADESVTIKKVIQLALQDFAVEVKAVPVGLDVLEVSKSFQPDLVFADILLQKRSGYDVCRDLKKDSQTAAIPVILMWSSFMELDAKQVDACGADGRLEKPFEVEMLRKLVLDLVPRTRSQRLATFLEYPATIAAPLKAEVDAEKAHRQAVAAANPMAAPMPTGPIENTSSIVIPKAAVVSPAPPPKPRMPPPLNTAPGAQSTKAISSPPTGSVSDFTPGIPDRPTQAEPSTMGYEASLSGASSPMFPTHLTDPSAKALKPPTAPASVPAKGQSTSSRTPESSIPTLQTKIAPVLGFTIDGGASSSSGSFNLSGDHPETSGAPVMTKAPPLGALPDLQLDGQPNTSSTSTGHRDSQWSMDSFEPLDLSPLTLDDDDGDVESFEPIRLPDSGPVANVSPITPYTPLSLDSDLLDSNKDDEADKWSNSSLDKYRLPPLQPDEALATDEMTPDFGSRQSPNEQNAARPHLELPVFELTSSQDEMTATPNPEEDEAIIPPSTLERTEIIHTRQRSPSFQSTDDVDENGDPVSEFTLSEADHHGLSNLEIEPVEQSELTRPSIVRELLRDPDFSYDDATVRQQEKTYVSPDGTVDLGSAGRPAARQPSPPPVSQSLESRVRTELGAQLEPQLEKMIEKIVAELLPKIAEKIIKRELERLLEDS